MVRQNDRDEPEIEIVICGPQDCQTCKKRKVCKAIGKRKAMPGDGMIIIAGDEQGGGDRVPEFMYDSLVNVINLVSHGIAKLMEATGHRNIKLAGFSARVRQEGEPVPANSGIAIDVKMEKMDRQTDANSMDLMCEIGGAEELEVKKAVRKGNDVAALCHIFALGIAARYFAAIKLGVSAADVDRGTMAEAMHVATQDLTDEEWRIIIDAVEKYGIDGVIYKIERPEKPDG